MLHTLRWAAGEGLRSYELLGEAEGWITRSTQEQRACVRVRTYPASAAQLPPTAPTGRGNAWSGAAHERHATLASAARGAMHWAQQAGGWLPDARAAGARIARRWPSRGIAVTIGYFQGDADGVDAIVAAYGRIAAIPLPPGSYLSVKLLPPLGLSAVAVALTSRGQARQRGRRRCSMPMPSPMPDATYDRRACCPAARLRQRGIVSPAAGAAQRRFDGAPVRDIKGVSGVANGADPPGDAADGDVAYLTLMELLAGRAAPKWRWRRTSLRAGCRARPVACRGGPCASITAGMPRAPHLRRAARGRGAGTRPLRPVELAGGRMRSTRRLRATSARRHRR